MNNIRICKNCGSKKFETVDSRGNSCSIRRRKKCISCGERFTTYEIDENDFVYLQNIMNERKNIMTFLEKTQETIKDFIGGDI